MYSNQTFVKIHIFGII